MISPILVATLLGQVNPDTGSLRETLVKAGDKAANWLLPMVTTVGTLPLVPDGTVAGRRYIPPNTAIDIVANHDALQTGMRRLATVAAIGGAVVGAAVVLIAKRKR